MSTSGIDLVKANFLSLVLETFLYGMFTVLFGASLWVIWNKQNTSNKLLLSTLALMWVLSTTHWILDIIRGMNAFIDMKYGSPLAFYSTLSDPLQAVKTAVYVTLTLVGDGFVIYRCYVVWGQRLWVIILPFLLLCGTGGMSNVQFLRSTKTDVGLASGYGATWAFSKAAPGAAVFLLALVPWITSFIALTFTTNVLCTILIAYRVMMIQNAIKSAAPTSRAQSALIIMAESAALYSASVLSLLITYQLGSNAQYIVLDFTSPLIGITFSIIILRVSMGLTSQKSVSRSQGNDGRTDRFPLSSMSRPVAVNVSHLVEYDTDGYGRGQTKGPFLNSKDVV